MGLACKDLQVIYCGLSCQTFHLKSNNLLKQALPRLFQH